MYTPTVGNYGCSSKRATLLDSEKYLYQTSSNSSDNSRQPRWGRRTPDLLDVFFFRRTAFKISTQAGTRRPNRRNEFSVLKITSRNGVWQMAPKRHNKILQTRFEQRMARHSNASNADSLKFWTFQSIIFGDPAIVPVGRPVALRLLSLWEDYPFHLDLFPRHDAEQMSYAVQSCALFVVGLYQVPGRLGRVRCCKHRITRPRIVMPPPMGFEVHGG